MDNTLPPLISSRDTGNISDNSLSEPSQEDKGWQLKTLKPKHKDICSLLAQGLDRGTIAKAVGCTPEYITMLVKQPLIKEYMAEMAQLAGIQLEAMFIKSVEVIGDTMDNGNHKERLQAARLQLETTRRIGSNSGLPKEVIDSADRLNKLSERLLRLIPERESTVIETTQDEKGTFQVAKKN